MSQTLRKRLIAGNWKMHYDHLQAITFVQQLAWKQPDLQHAPDLPEVAVFPPFTDLRSVQTLLQAEKLTLGMGAQDVSAHAPGAHTGEIAAEFLAKLQVKYVLVGHSERRADHGETDALVGKKAAAVHAQGMIPVICVGETAADLAAQGSSAVPVQQLTAVLSQLPVGAEFVVAYEPVWAIGSGQAASPAQAQEVAAALRAAIGIEMTAEIAEKTRILYGGSVTSDNVGAFLNEPDIDGALVGGASLKVAEFTQIINAARDLTV